ncbi:hypothetical protein Isop_0531 [Isosphaera pallida ATCC 43644]|jgi:hypothetical protein|uniref:Uncharacterized protein n=1 Tax=Isosphaera pallida (strain ATCC 43644 / DSM 9630 / IS1B) TaxID=575540 RepID=E8QZJ7_ISOPI|nr:hypothetical protein [Isosphaera pallida]ADV61124.1 hypothetical protein Isop_0531 [Isosphaera pallida ATCC 43644]
MDHSASLATVPHDPRRNPSYPAKIHAYEGPHWQAVVAQARSRVEAVRVALEGMAEAARQSKLRLYHQMLGALDQIEDMAKRLPGEVGDLYAEDRHKLEEAQAALDRLIARFHQP